jgi:hypothetical protein
MSTGNELILRVPPFTGRLPRRGPDDGGRPTKSRSSARSGPAVDFPSLAPPSLQTVGPPTSGRSE